MILEDQDVFETAVFLQIQETVAECPQNVFDSFWRQGREAGGVIGRLNDDLVRLDSVHAIEHALGLPVQRAFNAQGWKLIRHDADSPSRGITLWRRSAVRVGTIGLNLRR